MFRAGALGIGVVLVAAWAATFMAIPLPIPNEQAYGVEAQQQPSSATQNQSEADNIANPAIRLPDENASLNARERNEEGSEYWPPLLGYRLKITDTFLVLFTAVLAWFTRSLDRSTGKLWSATKESIDKAEKFSERQLRAYVGLKQLSFWFATSGTPTVVNGVFQYFVLVRVQNYGQTPARNITVVAHVVNANAVGAALPVAIVEQISDSGSIRDAGNFTSKFTLSPGQDEISASPIQEQRIINGLEASRIRLGTSYVIGSIYYEDIHGRPWRTMFCHAWEPWNPRGEQFVPYQFHNGEDQKRLEN